jgi:2-oxoglutarate ferredoxin oxidoreductase subunit beta
MLKSGKMADQKIQYKSDQKAVFCPGCGDYGVTASIIKAMTELGRERHNMLVVTGIGCSSSIANQFNTYVVHSIHGRSLPVGTGAKLANHELTVLCAGGDGDGYGIGVGHLIHAARRNLDLTYVVMNNEIYGLTTGQASPTSFVGMKTKTTPSGVIEAPINPMTLAISAGATYVARGFAGDPNHLSTLIKNGMLHKGFSIIDVFSPCVTFNHDNTYDWFRPRVYKLEESGHDPSDIKKAFDRARELDIGTDHIPIGLFYETQRPTYDDLEMSLKDGPIAKKEAPSKETVLGLLEKYR